jgi:hypothetical protein
MREPPGRRSGRQVQGLGAAPLAPRREGEPCKWDHAGEGDEAAERRQEDERGGGDQ